MRLLAVLALQALCSSAPIASGLLEGAGPVRGGWGGRGACQALRLRGGVGRHAAGEGGVAEATIDRVIETVRKEEFSDEGRVWRFGDMAAGAAPGLAFAGILAAPGPARAVRRASKAIRENAVAHDSATGTWAPLADSHAAATVAQGLRAACLAAARRLRWAYLARPRRLRPAWRRALSSLHTDDLGAAAAPVRSALAHTSQALAHSSAAVRAALARALAALDRHAARAAAAPALARARAASHDLLATLPTLAHTTAATRSLLASSGSAAAPLLARASGALASSLTSAEPIIARALEAGQRALAWAAAGAAPPPPRIERESRAGKGWRGA